MKKAGLIFLFLLAAVRVPSFGVDGPVVVPFHFVRWKIIVPVKIDGQNKRFFLDTGSRTCVSGELTEELGMGRIRSKTVYDSAGSEQTIPTAEIPGVLEFGGTAYRGVKVNILEDNEMFRCFDVDGIIGAELLQPFAVKLSLKDHTLTLSKRSVRRVRRQAERLPMSMVNGQPYIKVRSKGERKTKNDWILFDTGADGLSLSSGRYRHYESAGILGTYRNAAGKTYYGAFGTAPENLQKSGIIPEIRFGKSAIRQVPVALTHSDRSLFGTFLLQYGDVILDFRNMFFYFVPDNPVAEMARRRTVNVSIIFDDGVYQVGAVWDESLRDKIAPGDRIIHIGETLSSDLDFCGFLRGDLCVPLQSNLKILTSDGRIVDVPFQFIEQ